MAEDDRIVVVFTHDQVEDDDPFEAGDLYDLYDNLARHWKLAEGSSSEDAPSGRTDLEVTAVTWLRPDRGTGETRRLDIVSRFPRHIARAFRLGSGVPFVVGAVLDPSLLSAVVFVFRTAREFTTYRLDKQETTIAWVLYVNNYPSSFSLDQAVEQIKAGLNGYRSYQPDGNELRQKLDRLTEVGVFRSVDGNDGRWTWADEVRIG